MIPKMRAAALTADDYDLNDLRDDGVTVRMHRNECALPAPEHVVDAVRALTGNMLRQYPVELQRSFLAALSARLGTSPDRVVLGNGADEILSALARAFLDPGDDVITVRPAFGMYAHVTRAAGAQIRAVPYEQRWEFNARRLIEAADERTRLVLLCHPNNPTGEPLSASDLAAIARALPETLIVVDEVYVALSEASLIQSSLGLDNVAVLGSLSKMAALAGMRVGYAAASRPVAAALRRVIPPFPLAVASLAAADAYVRGGAASEAFDRALAVQTRRSLDRIAERLRPVASAVWPTIANFLLVDFGRLAAPIARALRDQGIAVRHFSDPMLTTCLRLCATDDNTTERVCDAVIDYLSTNPISSEVINA